MTAICLLVSTSFVLLGQPGATVRLTYEFEHIALKKPICSALLSVKCVPEGKTKHGRTKCLFVVWPTPGGPAPEELIGKIQKEPLECEMHSHKFQLSTNTSTSSVEATIYNSLVVAKKNHGGLLIPLDGVRRHSIENIRFGFNGRKPIELMLVEAGGVRANDFEELDLDRFFRSLNFETMFIKAPRKKILIHSILDRRTIRVHLK